MYLVVPDMQPARFGKAKSTMRTGFPKRERIQNGEGRGVNLGKGRRIGNICRMTSLNFFWGTRRTSTKVLVSKKNGYQSN